jgi:hypothetical protein
LPSTWTTRQLRRHILSYAAALHDLIEDTLRDAQRERILANATGREVHSLFSQLRIEER